MLRNISAVTLVLVPSLLGAQVAAFDVGLGVARGDTTSWTRRALIGSSLDLERRSGFASFDATIASGSGGLDLPDARFTAATRFASVGPVQFSATVDGLRGPAAEVGHEYFAGANLGASARFGSAGGFVTAGRRSGAVSDLGLGGWKSWRGALFAITRKHSFVAPSSPVAETVNATLSVNTALDSVPVIIPSPSSPGSSRNSRFEQWTQTEARMDLTAGRLQVHASVTSRGRNGHPDSTRATSWARVDVAARIDSRWSVIGGAGSVPMSADPHARTRRFLSLGLRVSPRGIVREPLPVVIRPAATAFTLLTEAEGKHRLRLIVPGARTVALSGDFTEWKPVTLREVAPGVWEVTLPIKPGVHHVSVSVNGEGWTAPAGLPSVEDEFNGGARVGVIVVR